MASTIFVNQTTVVDAPWLNDVNNVTYVTVPGLNTTISNLPNMYVGKDSSTGAALLPVGNTTQRPNSTAVGQLRYNNLTAGFEGYGATGWGSIGGASGGAVANSTIYENKRVLTSNYTLTANSSAHTVGPFTVATGVSLTIPSGERFVVL